MIKTGPEAAGVSGPHRSQDGLLLEVEVVGIVLGQVVHQRFLHIALYRFQLVGIVHHVGNGTRLVVLSQQLLVVEQRFHVVGPATIIDSLAKDVEEFTRRLCFLVEDGGASHVFQLFHVPPVFHAFLHTYTVTLVHRAILVEHHAAYYIEHEYGQWRVAFLRTLRELIHLIALATQPTQCQIAHHHDGSGWLTVLLRTFLDDAFPVGLLYAALHAQLVVEVGILIPEMIDAGDKDDAGCKRYDVSVE